MWLVLLALRLMGGEKWGLGLVGEERVGFMRGGEVDWSEG